MKGYKAFGKDWTCRGKQYRVGDTFEEDVLLDPCYAGMHFCDRLPNVFRFYIYDPNQTVVAEVEAIGEVKTDDDIKFCTDKLLIIREIPWDEVQKACNIGICNTGDWNTGNQNAGNWNTGNCNTGICNTGDCNTGNRNTGNCNTGNWNTGNCNTGNWNTGDCNTGSWNTGSWNTGSWNTGNRNAGNCNTGDWNTGNWNTGDWNKSSFNNGCFMTIESKIMMFNKPSDWTYLDWMGSDARQLLNQIPKNVVKWIDTRDMTDDEKLQHPEYKTTGGYLDVQDKSDCAQLWWNSLEQNERDVIMALPNFDADIFMECTGIDVREN